MVTHTQNIIRIIQQYIPSSDTLQSTLIIRLQNQKEVFAIFEHQDTFTITNEELIKQLRSLADHIEKQNAQS